MNTHFVKKATAGACLAAAGCLGLAGCGSDSSSPAAGSTLTPQTITFATPAAETVGTPATISATASSGLAVSFASESSAVCTVSGTTVTPVAAGQCSITASQAGNSTYAAAPSVTDTFTVNAAPSQIAQTINFPQPAAETVGTTATISAQASSNLTVSFASNSPSVCTVSGTTVTPLAAGTCSITASQAGNATYAAATPVTDTFAVSSSLTAQTITFPTPAAETVGTPATISATSTSNLTVSFASNSTTICTVSGTTVTPLAAGTCSITASQAGNGTYAAATPVTDTFAVTAVSVPQLVFVTGFTNGGLTVDGGATGGYGGSDQITSGCNGGQFCGGGSAANSSDAASSEYYYIQSQTPSTGFQFVGLYAFAPGVTALSTTGNTSGVQINGQTSVTFGFNQNPEWASQTSANGGNNITIILVLGNLYTPGGGTCNVTLQAVITPTGGASEQSYTVPFSDFFVAQNCGISSLTPTSVTAALAASAGGPIAQFNVRATAAPARSRTARTDWSAAPTRPWPTSRAAYPTTVSLTGPITFQ